MILDTTVLIDLQRELRRGAPGPASAVLRDLGDSEVAISFVTWMEFAEGYGTQRRSACELFLSRFLVLWPTAETAWLASRICRGFSQSGNEIGDHDAWIAALAMQHDRAVVSRNERRFSRVPELTLRSY